MCLVLFTAALFVIENLMMRKILVSYSHLYNEIFYSDYTSCYQGWRTIGNVSDMISKWKKDTQYDLNFVREKYIYIKKGLKSKYTKM